jgi:hypothetical protein
MTTWFRFLLNRDMVMGLHVLQQYISVYMQLKHLCSDAGCRAV